MAQSDSKIACVPLTYGYVSYARAGFRPVRLAFADIPAAGGNGPIGSALGGTGIAVSARSAEREAAIEFAYWIASAEVQGGLYAAAGGQPGHAAAWASPEVNAPVDGFYAKTRATLDSAWVRPRHDGYMEFQEMASRRLLGALKAGDPAPRVIADLNRLFAAAFTRTTRSARSGSAPAAPSPRPTSWSMPAIAAISSRITSTPSS
jgi:multiple sugar transport system substrate-binding protein